MASHSNHQSDNKKHSKNRDGLDKPEFNPTVSARGENPKFLENLDGYKDFLAWAR